MNKIEYGVVIKFLSKQGKTPKRILEERLTVYGDNCPLKSTICGWSKFLNMVENHWMLILVQAALLMYNLIYVWYFMMQTSEFRSQATSLNRYADIS